MAFEQLKQLRWPFGAAITISLLALALSLAQMFLTVPILTSYYFKPKLVVGGTDLDGKPRPFGSEYLVSNAGNAAATKIEVGLVLRPGQRLELVPNISARIIEDKDPLFANNIRVEVDRLNAGESFKIVVPLDPKNETAKRDFYDFYIRIRGSQITFVRSAEGAGRIATEDQNESTTRNPRR